MYAETEKAFNSIPKRYHKYKRLQNKQFGKRLADYALWDYKIELKLRISPKFFPMYKLTEIEKQVFKKFIRENLRLRRIRPLQSLVGYSVLFIPKKSGQFKLCINYRQLNSIIKKDRYLLPLINEI